MSEVVFTITAGNAGENHAGMEMIGKKWTAGMGHSVEDLERFQAEMEKAGARTELVRLSSGELPPAAVLVIKKGIDVLLGAGKTAELFVEQAALAKDTKAKMRGRVVNKHARHNLCFAEEGHAADFEKGMGTVVAYGEVPLTNALVRAMEASFNPTAKLIAEGNYYYDLKKCGIGFHGDSERMVVYAARLGAAMPMHFQWFHRSLPIGERFIIPLEGGDVYIMSEKAVGADWKCSSRYTLRHATGCKKFTDIKPKVKKAKAEAKAEAPKAVGGAGAAPPEEEEEE